MDILEPEELKTREISVPITSSPAIQRPAARGNSGGSSAGQLKNRADSSDESEDEDEDDLPVVINKSKKSSSTRELAGLQGNLERAWEAPAGSHRMGRTDHCGRMSSRIKIKCRSRLSSLGRSPW